MDFLEELVDDKFNILDEYYEHNLKDDLSDFSKNIIDNFKNEYENDGGLIKKLKRNSEMVILNHC